MRFVGYKIDWPPEAGAGLPRFFGADDTKRMELALSSLEGVRPQVHPVYAFEDQPGSNVQLSDDALMRRDGAMAIASVLFGMADKANAQAAFRAYRVLKAAIFDAAASNRVEDAKVLDEVRKIVTGYHLALDKRQHGGQAANHVVDALQQLLGMPWVQGQALKQSQAQGGSNG